MFLFDYFINTNLLIKSWEKSCQGNHSKCKLEEEYLVLIQC